jgi:ABC-type antimicrobial peptide transport system permease subunit
MGIELGMLTPIRLAWGENSLDFGAIDWNWELPLGRRAAHGVGKRTPFDSFPLGVELSMTVNTVVMYDAKLADALNLINSDPGEELTEVELIIAGRAIVGKLSGLSGKVDLENELQISWTVTGHSKEAGSGATLLTAGSVFIPDSIVFNNLGSDLKASVFNFNVSNAITPRRYMGGTRTPAVLAEGKQLVGFDFTLLEVPDVPADITADMLAKIAASAVSIADTQETEKTLTISFTGALPTNQTGSGNMEDIIEHGVNYEADAISFGVA